MTPTFRWTITCMNFAVRNIETDHDHLPDMELDLFRLYDVNGDVALFNWRNIAYITITPVQQQASGVPAP